MLHTGYVLITGASHGIGQATARLFAGHGYPLILNGFHSPDALEALGGEIRGHYHVSCETTVGDAGNAAYVQKLFEDLAARGLAPEILINNAGISYIGLFQDMSSKEWQHILNTNLTSCFLFCKGAIPLMLRRGGGSIVNVSSVWGNVGASCEVAYSATKGGINAMTRALAKELAPSRIRCNAAAFGAIDTAMNHFLDEEETTALLGEIPAGRLGTPEEAAALIYDLAVNHPYLTGQVITMDGGWT